MGQELQIENVVKSYGKKRVLDEISFSAKPGEFIVLVGPSGCGKSTMLRAIAGLEDIDSGKISIKGEDVTALPPKDREIAMVFQDYALYPHLSVYDNIAFGLKIRGVDKAVIQGRVIQVAEQLELRDLLKRRPKELSGGQRQRVAIGRAIVRKPSVFLFDEPLSNLDAKLRGSMRLTIGRLHRLLAATVVYVTHDQVEAMTLADRIIVLDRGEIQQMGTPLELYHNPKNTFVAQFIGSPPMNLINGELLDEDGLHFISEQGWRVPIGNDQLERVSGATGRRVIWGVRSEDLQVSERGFCRAQVDVVEPLGASTSVFADAGGESLHLTLPSGAIPCSGEHLELAWKGKHLYMFDHRSGQRL